ncbi:MAG: carbohydrate kinase family protein [Patescibacteria group bacterium]
MTADNTAYDLITIGDSTIDTFIKIHDATVECDINHEACRLCVSYGDKIPVEGIFRAVAGNAANVATAAAKLGIGTAIYTNVGGDTEGKLIKTTLEKAGVGSDYIVVDASKASNTSAIITFQGERTAFVYHQPWFYHLPDLARTKWVYFTSVSQSFIDSNIVDEVAHYIDKTGAKLAFAPGTFQIKANIKRYPKTLERCELLACNVEEAKKILEIDPVQRVDIHDLLAKLHLLGPKIILITDGEEGSYTSDGNKILKAGVFPAQIVEKTGVGDAYCASFISALINGETIGEAMIWGTINASHVLRHLGPQTGQMKKEDLLRYRKSVPEMVVRNF